jgi:hypothetical protein
LDNHVAKFFIDGIKDDNAASGGATLPGVTEGRKQYPFSGVVQVGIVADDKGILSA